MGSFVLDLSRFKIKTEEQMSKVVRKIVLDMHSRLIVQGWPVATGLSKGNNQISLNNLPTSSVLIFDKDGTVTVENGKAVMAGYKLGDTIFLYNNVAYAIALEYGHSQQAPQGRYRLAVQTIINHFDRHARSA